MRGRSYRYSPSPPRNYRSSRRRSPSPRGSYGGRSRDGPTSLLVRNLRHDCRPEDLRRPFGEFGPLKDVYLPRDYHSGPTSNKTLEKILFYMKIEGRVECQYINEDSSHQEFQIIITLNPTREPRGFGFVQYVHPADAEDAKYHMDGQVFLGRELTVVFAEENRKKPQEMRARERVRGRSYDRKPSPQRYRRSYSRSPDYYSPSPRRREYSRSISPPRRSYRGRSYSRSPRGSRSRSRTPVSSRSWSRSRSRSPEPY